MLRPVFLLVIFFVCAPQAVAQAPRRDRLEERIDRALVFLKTMQEKDGSWQGAPFGARAAMTGLSVLAFLSAGHVPGEGPYRATIEKGIRWVLRSQRPNGSLSNDDQTEMYQHGICTLMLAEVAGMTDPALSREVKSGLEKAVALMLKAQRMQPGPHKGGWRYRVEGYDSDMSITGWQVLALRAAKNLGCDVPAERIDLAVEYVKRCRDPSSGGFSYMAGGAYLTLACSGVGILCLELAGSDRHHSRDALQAGSLLLKSLPQWSERNFFYTIYYGAQATFQLGNNYWNFYRPHLHKTLFDYQQTNGSWIHNDGLGPVYASAMAVLALTVEYRFLPIYQRAEEAPEKK